MTSIRIATCRCGQLRASCSGDPVRISVCHCLNCKKRSGSAFSAQARWPDDQVTIGGAAKTWSYKGESGNTAIFSFCPQCGSTLFYASDGMPGLTAVAIGGFADPAFAAPQYSVYEGRKHDWVEIVGENVERYD